MEQTDRKPKESAKVDAVHFIALVDALGHAKATELLGVAAGTTHRWYSDRRVSFVVEALSRRLVDELTGTGGKPTLLAVKVRADKVELVKTFLKGAECQFMEWKI